MQDDTESRIKQDLLAEINVLEQNYAIIRGYLSGADYDVTEIGGSLKAFKDSLSRASAFILALYNLKGQRIKIPWESLFTSLDYALATIAVSPTSKQKAAIKTILTMSESQIEQVMSYFSTLKESLKYTEL